jgi:hypothetical protein
VVATIARPRRTSSPPSTWCSRHPDPAHPLGRIVGDLLVPPASAHGRSGDGRHVPFPDGSERLVGGVTHLGLMRDAAVYEQILSRLIDRDGLAHRPRQEGATVTPNRRPAAVVTSAATAVVLAIFGMTGGAGASAVNEPAACPAARAPTWPGQAPQGREPGRRRLQRQPHRCEPGVGRPHRHRAHRANLTGPSSRARTWPSDLTGVILIGANLRAATLAGALLGRGRPVRSQPQRGQASRG